MGKRGGIYFEELTPPLWIAEGEMIFENENLNIELISPLFDIQKIF